MINKQINYEQVLEWFEWTPRISSTGVKYAWDSPDKQSYVGNPEVALANPDYQARYFDPYILEKGYWLHLRIEKNKVYCEILDYYNEHIAEVTAQTEALAKSGAYHKLCEVENAAHM